jgi:hypothetical protein
MAISIDCWRDYSILASEAEEPGQVHYMKIQPLRSRWENAPK